MIRRAQVADVPAIARIINDAADRGLMLHRSLADLFENVRDYHVAVEPSGGEVIGVCGLKVVWANWAEVYALAVDASHRNRGLGGQLVRACMDDARTLGVPQLMCLTYERAFFERLGFRIVDRQQLPLKVWSECLRCAKRDACDEIAMQITLPDVEPVAAPAPLLTAHHERYEVPVPLAVAGQRVPGPMDAPR